MRRSEAFPSKYIGKDDLEVPVLLTIGEVSTAMVKGDHGDECKTVMMFREQGVKAMIMNNCNWMTLEDAYGEESDDWNGKPVELYVDPNVMFGGKRVGGVRVRVSTPQAPPILAPVPVAPTPAGDLLNFQQAQDLCATVKITKDELVASLKGNGCEGYNSARDTAHVRSIVANVQARDGHVPLEDDDIPF
jgi:hypothetical protein